MRTCPAAALALVGWYLVVPPNGSTKVPLSQWRMDGSFDSAALCAEARTQKLDAFEKELDHFNHFDLKTAPTAEVSAKLEKALARYFAECIASDDPRLKEK